MGQRIREWTKQNLWKTAFKKFYLVHSWIHWPIWCGYYGLYEEEQRQRHNSISEIIHSYVSWKYVTVSHPDIFLRLVGGQYSKTQHPRMVGANSPKILDIWCLSWSMFVCLEKLFVFEVFLKYLFLGTFIV